MPFYFLKSITPLNGFMMLKRHWGFIVVFAIIALVQLVSEYFNLEPLRFYTKPLITIWLSITLIIATSLKGRFHKRVFTGLAFALIGDVLLTLVSVDQKYFSYGLLAFLLCHLFYIRAFYLDFKSAPELDKRGARIAIISCAALSIAFFFYLRPYLGMMRIPVLAYVLVISLMVMMAAFRNLRVNILSLNLILAGAVCFMLSDSILAYNKFVHQFDHANVLVMATYMFAQFLITLGAIERKLLHTN